LVYAQVEKSIAKINHLIDTTKSSNKFGPIHSHLNSSLLLGIPINWSLIEQVQNVSDRMTSGHVMVEVGIEVMSQYNALGKKSGNILRNITLH
jgi:hypothetical protein